MDDILTARTLLPTVKNVEIVPVGAIRKKENKDGPLKPAVAYCLLQDENIKGRYIALKSANDRQIVATGFTHTIAYNRAKRKGYDSCLVISNQRE